MRGWNKNIRRIIDTSNMDIYVYNKAIIKIMECWYKVQQYVNAVEYKSHK